MYYREPSKMKFQSDYISNLDSAYDVEPNPYRVGDIVYLNGKREGRGRVSFVGNVHFTDGEVVGIALDNPLGFHDGAYGGARYFRSMTNHGIFARQCYISRYPWVATTKDQVRSGVYSRSNSPFITSRSPSPSPSTSSSTNSGGNSIFNRKFDDTPFIGDRVIVRSAVGEARTGVLRFLGRVDFSSGIWAGVELDGPWGRNDGTVLGRKYFKCLHPYGIFVPAHRVVTSPTSSWRWPTYSRFNSYWPRASIFDGDY